MHETPASPAPGRERPGCVPAWPEWMDDPAYLAARDGDLDLRYADPDEEPPPDVDYAELAAETAEILAARERRAALLSRLGLAGELAAATAAGYGRRGPGMPGSADSFVTVYASRSSGFASGKPLHTAPGCLVLGQFAEQAAGDDDRYPGASDDEIAGAIAAWERVESYACSRKHAAAAALIRLRPAKGCDLAGPAQMPGGFDEFTPKEVAAVLGETRAAAEDLLGLAHELEVNLPGTRAAFRDGLINQRKAAIIAKATEVLTPDEARAAEAKVLDRAGAMTPPALRAAIGRAVMQVAPAKAKQRREHEARKTRVERWVEASGNAGLAGRELPPAQVLAADQRVTAWARELRQAGLAGGMDALRARAFLDIMLGTDSRPPGATPGADTSAASTPGCTRGPQEQEQTQPQGPGPSPEAAPGPGGPADGVIPPGFAGHVNLTIPAVTVLGLAGRPGELGGIGPVDPDLARDLAAAAARNPRSTWCVTITDQDGHAVAHGCARPVKRRTPGGHDPPRGSPGFTLTPTSRPGTWRFSTGQQNLIIVIESLSTQNCDHRHQARGHDPGVRLRHLTEVRNATCTGPGCQRPATSCDFEHSIAYEAGGRTCLCNADPKCRHDHRLKQDPRWRAEHLPGGYVRWTTPSGRQYTTEPTRYPI